MDKVQLRKNPKIRWKHYLKLIGVGILSQLSFLAFILFAAIILSPLAILGVEIQTPLLYLVCDLLFLLFILFVYKKSKEEETWRTWLFGLVPTLVSMVFYDTIPYFATERASGWSGLRIFTIDPFGVHTISIFNNVPVLFVPIDIFYFLSVIVVIAAFFLSLNPLIKRFGYKYLPSSIAAILIFMGAILFFDFLNSGVLSGPWIAGAYVPLLLSGALLTVYFSFNEYPESVYIRSFSVYILFLCLGIIQDFGLTHLPILWSPIDFSCVCLPCVGCGCVGILILFWCIPIPLFFIDCLTAYLLS
ncbi:MAG TPA: hypothetical protein ENG74_01455 [Thermoplasmatales archaeon]|nr:hypothetical protein [Thermoplasmatales archaeon]